MFKECLNRYKNHYRTFKNNKNSKIFNIKKDLSIDLEEKKGVEVLALNIIINLAFNN